MKVSYLITKFFKSPKNYEITFKNEFEQRHWIMTAFRTLQQQQDVRQYLKDKATYHDFEFSYKTQEQKQEIESIADLARILFTILIECDFIPTSYLSILAIVMCQNPNLDYPSSQYKTNSNHIDLLLNKGAVQITY